MANVTDFDKQVEMQVLNHSIYVWGTLGAENLTENAGKTASASEKRRGGHYSVIAKK